LVLSRVDNPPNISRRRILFPLLIIEALRSQDLDTKIVKSQAKSLELSNGKLGKSGLKAKLTTGFYRGN
jgi:hypothetical protein